MLQLHNDITMHTQNTMNTLLGAILCWWKKGVNITISGNSTPRVLQFVFMPIAGITKAAYFYACVNINKVFNAMKFIVNVLSDAYICTRITV